MRQTNMSFLMTCATVGVLTAALHSAALAALQARDLRLVPYPKHIALSTGALRLAPRMTIQVTDSPATLQAADDLKRELAVAARVSCTVHPVAAARGFATLTLSSGRPVSAGLDSIPSQNEGYRLDVTTASATVRSKTTAGLANGIQTLRQLVRANLHNGSMPAMSITDYPSLRYRGWSNDITRGPSPKLGTLQDELKLTASLKMNMLSYYIEHQFAYKKHPDIGPKDGSLAPEELKALVADSHRYNLEVVGNQQSFGHLATILEKPAYKDLQESPGVINPTNEKTYQLLDDLYSEQAPLTDSRFFNVCCDETEGLGTGPSKDLVAKIGVGGVYAQHMTRLHDILRDGYGKRMMMWGDIISAHPGNLKDIPKDTVMLSWGYGADASFEYPIAPFANSGYDFFVCPATSCWNRILPVFDTAVTNIHNFVRDGAKHGALGMLNTTWRDTGETLMGSSWHALAWGAECSWNASTTDIGDFNRRIGAVLFGERGDHFGQGIQLLGKVHQLSGYSEMMDARFWRFDGPRLPGVREAEVRDAKALLAVVDPALAHLRAAHKEARFNADLLDCLIMSTERARLMATRSLGILRAADLYQQALESPDKGKQSQLAQGALAAARGVRDEHIASKARYRAIWEHENRPYALKPVMVRYQSMIDQYGAIVKSMERAVSVLKSGKPLPSAREAGIELSEMGARPTTPTTIDRACLSPGSDWAFDAFTRRIGIELSSGKVDRVDAPVQLDLRISPAGSNSVRLAELDHSGKQIEALGQLVTVGDHKRLSFIAPGRTPAGSTRRFFVYLDPSGQAVDRSGISCKDGEDGMKIIEDDLMRVAIHPSGAHIQKSGLKGLNNVDLACPGTPNWAAFGDIWAHRHTCKVEVLESGPALVSLKFDDELGFGRVVNFWAGVPWVEMMCNTPVGQCYCYDAIGVLSSSKETPRDCIFGDGSSDKVTDGRVPRYNIGWSAKYAKGSAMLGLLTPETTIWRYWVGPGANAGGLGFEGNSTASHIVFYGGLCPDSPKDTMDALSNTLDLRQQPDVGVYAAQLSVHR